MLGLGLGLDQLRADDVADRVSDEHRGRHEALLGLARDVSGAQGHGQAYDGPKESQDRIPDHGRGRSIAPLGLPDDNEARNDRERAQDQGQDPDILVLGAQPAGQDNAHARNGPERELDQNALEAGETKSRHDERPEPGHGPVDGIASCHFHQHTVFCRAYS